MKIKIDGLNYEVEVDDRLIDVVNRVGKELPQVCYHRQLGPIQKFGEVSSRLLYPAWRVRLSSRPSMPMRVNVSINDHRFKRRPVRRMQRFSAEKLSLLKITLSNLKNKSMTQTSISAITPINRDELVRLSEKGKGNSGAVGTLKAKTVLESKFRHLNYIRNLAAHVIDEPPGLLGDDTAPNPSEAAHGTGGNETDLIPLGQSLDLTKQNPREVMKDNEILQYFEAADLSDGL